MKKTSLRDLLMLNVGGNGGSSNVVAGTFTGETAGSAMTIDVPYTGNGYPIAGIIYPSDGSFAGDIALLVQQSAAFFFAFVKNSIKDAPTYNDADNAANKAGLMCLYKNSDSDPVSSAAGRSLQQAVYRNNDASNTYSNMVRFKSDKIMSVYIADTSYGFPKDVEFTYYLIYSE